MEVIDNAVEFVKDNKTTIAIALVAAVIVLAIWLYYFKK